MKEYTTKDKVIIKVEKNEEKSIIGQYVAYNIYDGADKLLGLRVGVRDIEELNYADLFEKGLLKFDMRDPNRKKPEKKEKVKQEKVPKKIEKAENITAETPTEVPAMQQPRENNDTPSGFVDTDMTINITIRAKKRINPEDVISYLQARYELYNLHILAQERKTKSKE